MSSAASDAASQRPEATETANKEKKHFYTKETGRALGDPVTAVR